jgi:hypothetical protein
MIFPSEDLKSKPELNKLFKINMILEKQYMNRSISQAKLFEILFLT